MTYLVLFALIVATLAFLAALAALSMVREHLERHDSAKLDAEERVWTSDERAALDRRWVEHADALSRSERADMRTRDRLP